MSDLKITYTNLALIRGDDLSIAIFANDAAANSIIWRVIKPVKYRQSVSIIYPQKTQVMATWDNDTSQTMHLDATIGKRYDLLENRDGFDIREAGNARKLSTIDICNMTHLRGANGYVLKDGRPLLCKSIMYDTPEMFILPDVLSFAIVLDAEEGKRYGSAKINTSYLGLCASIIGAKELNIGLYRTPDGNYKLKGM